MPLPAPTRGARAFVGKRMTANPAKAVDRWRPGQELDKPSSDEDSSEEESEEEHQQQQPSKKQPGLSLKGMRMQRADDHEHEAQQARARQADEAARQEEFRMREQMERDAGFVTESDSESEDEDEDAPRDTALPSDTVTRKQPPTRIPKAESSSEDESSGEDDDSSEEESSSEDEKPRMIRPVFVRKDQRSTAKPSQADSLSTYQTAEQAEALKARRQAEADALIQEEIDRKAAAKAAAAQDWDADDGGIEDEDAIDDTDDLDAELEHKLWIARELSRLKRDRAALEEREAELAELERRRNLATPDREAEDAAHLAAQQDARAGRSKIAHLQKYHHRGAFFADDDDAAHLRDRDVMGARFVDQADKTALPAYLQRRDETKIGKKGATRYRDMRSEDTGQFGEVRAGRDGRARAERGRDVERDREHERERTGANASALGGKRKGLSTSDALRETAKKMRVE